MPCNLATAVAAMHLVFYPRSNNNSSSSRNTNTTNNRRSNSCRQRYKDSSHSRDIRICPCNQGQASRRFARVRRAVPCSRNNSSSNKGFRRRRRLHHWQGSDWGWGWRWDRDRVLRVALGRWIAQSLLTRYCLRLVMRCLQGGMWAGWAQRGETKLLSSHCSSYNNNSNNNNNNISSSNSSLALLVTKALITRWILIFYLTTQLVGGCRGFYDSGVLQC